MIKLIAMILACYGLTAILVDGSILNTPRYKFQQIFPKIGESLNCYQCSGFHSGWVMWLIMRPQLTDHWYLSIFVAALIGSGTSYLINTLKDVLKSTSLRNEITSEKMLTEKPGTEIDAIKDQSFQPEAVQPSNTQSSIQ